MTAANTPTKDQLLKNKLIHYNKNPIQFIEDMFQVELSVHQKDFLNSLKQFIFERIYADKVRNGEIKKTQIPKEYRELESNKKVGITISSGRACGKSSIMCLSTFWLLTFFKDLKVVVFEPSDTQIKSVVISEFIKWINKVDNNGDWVFPLRDEFVLTNEGLKLKNPKKQAQMICKVISRNRPPEELIGAISGLHSDFMVFFLDEAISYQKVVWETLIGSCTSKVNFLCSFFNPVEMSYAISTVFDEQESKPWMTKIWDFEESEFCNEDILYRLEEKFGGRHTSEYRANVNGIYDLDRETNLIPTSYFTSACERVPLTGPIHFGVDVSGSGSDATVVCVFNGYTLTNIYKIVSTNTQEIIYEISQLIMLHSPVNVNCDSIGIGENMTQQLRVIHKDIIKPINVSTSSSNKDKYPRLRDEMFWNIRQLFEKEILSITVQDYTEQKIYLQQLKTELTSISYEDEGGRIKIQAKKDMKKTLGHSPDFADAFCLAFIRNNFITTESYLRQIEEGIDKDTLRKLNKNNNMRKKNTHYNFDQFNGGGWMAQ